MHVQVASVVDVLETISADFGVENEIGVYCARVR